jgi:hypothetical protein
VTNSEPEAGGNAGAVKFDTVGSMYDTTFVRNAERVSTETDALGIEAKPRATFRRKADDAFHSVIIAAVPPADALGDDSSVDMCLPKTVANDDPVEGREREKNDDTETPK